MFLQNAATLAAATAAPYQVRGLLPTLDRPRPTRAQLQWQRDECAMFIHFGINTFTDREWGDGSESPSLFNPSALDARQWARSAKAAGFRALVLTAKHHDGFCLWPTATTAHSVASSPWRSGHGDVVREFVDACAAEGLRAGLYLSPWDRNNPAYGTDRYNDLYAAQLTELLTGYGRLSEVWFDGANGEGPDGRRQVYDWPRTFGMVRRHQPDAVIFSDAGPDVRWCGNETGSAGDPNWSTVDPAIVPFPGATGPHVIPALQHGDSLGSVWRPAEADVSIRPGWFYHATEDTRVRSVGNLVDLYVSSVGRNSKLLLNVPPTRDGLLHTVDVERLVAMRGALEVMFERDAAAGVRRQWRHTGARSMEVTIDFGHLVDLSAIRLEEDIEKGQLVASHSVSLYTAALGWREVARGTTVGYARIHRIAPTRASRIRIVVNDSVDTPLPLAVKAYRSADETS